MMTWKVLTSASWRLAVALLGTLALLADTGRAAIAPATAESQFMQLLNAARAQDGRPALTRDPALDGVAREWSAEMARTGVFEHRPDLGARIAAIEPQRRAWAENIAWRQDPGGLTETDVTSVHNGLMASPGHHANIMGDFNRVGVGVVISGDTLWVTFDFLKGPAISPPPATTPGPAPGPPPPAAAPADPSSHPVGWFRMKRLERNRVRVTGWAVDPDTRAPIRVRVTTRTASRTQLASRTRRDVTQVYPTLGPDHGFAMTIRARGGARVCVDAFDAAGARTRIGCRRVPR